MSQPGTALSESSMWLRVRQIAGEIARKEFSRDRSRIRSLAVELENISWAALQQLKQGVHENPRPRRTRRRMGLIKDMRFFRQHGGGVVGEAARGALDLARAEREAERRGWRTDWEYDEGADWSWLDQPGFEREKAKEHEVYVAILRDKNGYVLASLGGIFDPDRRYMRVVEAELASEALSRAQPLSARRSRDVPPGSCRRLRDAARRRVHGRADSSAQALQAHMGGALRITEQ